MSAPSACILRSLGAPSWSHSTNGTATSRCGSNDMNLQDRASLRLTRIARVMIIVLGLNLVVALAKLIYGYRSHAIAITADGVHSLLDAASNVVGLVGVRVARRPADRNHPYGHRKYETFAAMGVAMMLFLGCWEIGVSALERVLHPRLPDVDVVGYAVIGITLAINAAVVFYETRAARALHSELLESDAAHTGSDVFATLLVLASFIAIRFPVGWADGRAAGLTVGLLGLAGGRILKGTLSTLSGRARLGPVEVETVGLAEAGLVGVPNVATRGPGGGLHLGLHI